MTRESEKSKIRMSVIVDGKHINSLKKADEVIDQIFDEHEAQLKAKDEEIEKLKSALSKIISKDIVGGFKLGDKKARSIVAMLFWEQDIERCIVIGNIYQNPELLENK